MISDAESCVHTTSGNITHEFDVMVASRHLRVVIDEGPHEHRMRMLMLAPLTTGGSPEEVQMAPFVTRGQDHGSELRAAARDGDLDKVAKNVNRVSKKTRQFSLGSSS